MIPSIHEDTRTAQWDFVQHLDGKASSQLFRRLPCQKMHGEAQSEVVAALDERNRPQMPSFAYSVRIQHTMDEPRSMRVGEHDTTALAKFSNSNKLQQREAQFSSL